MKPSALTTALLKASAALQEACDLERQAGRAEQFYDLRRAGWIVADALAQGAKTVPAEQTS